MGFETLRDGIHVNRHDDHVHITSVQDGTTVDVKLWPDNARNLAAALHQIAAEAAAHAAPQPERPKRLWSSA